MNKVAPVIGMFLGVFVTAAGCAKLFETIMLTFIPNYGHAYHEHSAELHFAFFMIAAGVTTIWSLGRR